MSKREHPSRSYPKAKFLKPTEVCSSCDRVGTIWSAPNQCSDCGQRFCNSCANMCQCSRYCHTCLQKKGWDMCERCCAQFCDNCIDFEASVCSVCNTVACDMCSNHFDMCPDCGECFCSDHSEKLAECYCCGAHLCDKCELQPCENCKAELCDECSANLLRLCERCGSGEVCDGCQVCSICEDVILMQRMSEKRMRKRILHTRSLLFSDILIVTVMPF